MNELTHDVVQTIQSVAKLLAGYKRRQFQSQMAFGAIILSRGKRSQS